MSTVHWRLRYRSPINLDGSSSADAVHNVTIATKKDDPHRARQVADHFLATKVPHPNTRFVRLEPGIVHTEEDLEAAEAAQGRPAAPQPAATGGRVGA